MRRHHPWIGSLFLLAFVASAFAVDEKKDEQADTPKHKESLDKMMTAGEVTGKLVHWGEGSQKYLTVDVTIKYQVPNLDAARNMANLQRQALEAARDPNPANRAKRLQDIQVEILKNQRNAATMKEEHKKVELQAADSMVVRTQHVQPIFDEKGNVKRPSAKELKERKGSDPKLPGYTAELSDLKQDQIVKVYIAKKKDAGRPFAKVDKDELADKPTVNMILILEEPALAK